MGESGRVKGLTKYKNDFIDELPKSAKSLSIEAVNFNFQYKYYNVALNYRRNRDLAKFLRHLCNAVKNPA